MAAITRMSASQLTKALKCMRRWYYDHVLYLPVPYASPMAIGRSFHKSVEDNLTNKIETKELLSREKVLDIASDMFDKESMLVEEWSEERGESKDKVIRISTKHYDDTAPNLSPAFVEKYFEMQVGDLTINGYIDIVETDNNGSRIIDTKFKNKTPSGPISETQRIWYPKAARDVFGLEIDSFTFDVYVPLKKEVKHIPIPSKPNKEEEDRLEQEMFTRVKMAEAGLFPRVAKELGICSYCPHRDYCWHKDKR